jgi:hypothetical protein
MPPVYSSILRKQSRPELKPERKARKTTTTQRAPQSQSNTAARLEQSLPSQPSAALASMGGLSAGFRSARPSTSKRKPPLSRELLIKRIVGWAVLMPLCLITLTAFLKYFLPALLDGRLFGSSSMRWFLVGASCWSLLHFALHRQLMVLYVFGHEWTHALAAHLCFAKVYRVRVRLTDGYVETNKSNVFISLSPYVVPFYTMVFAALFYIADASLDLATVKRLTLGRFSVPFNHELFFFFSVGVTWSFHLLYTLTVLKTTQSDLTRNDESFSLFLILTLNLYLLATLLLISSPALGWQGAWDVLSSCFVYAWDSIGQTARMVKGLAR